MLFRWREKFKPKVVAIFETGQWLESKGVQKRRR